MYAFTGINVSTETGDANPDISPEVVASISLPPSLFLMIEGDGGRHIGLVFTFYQTAAFFPVLNYSSSIKVGTPVIGAAVTLVDQSFVDLEDPVDILLQVNQVDEEVIV